MTAATEITIGESWIYQMLVGDATLAGLGYDEAHVWTGVAPAGTEGDYIIIARQASRDVNGLGNRLARIMSSIQFQVAATGEGPQWEGLADGAKRIDELLHGKEGTVLDDAMAPLGYVLSSVREQPLSLVMTIDGKYYRRLGGLYRLQVQGA